jgi:hypothetical protein
MIWLIEERMKLCRSTMMSDEEQPEDKPKPPAKQFPYPRFVLTIYSPLIVTADANNDYASVWKVHRVA